MRAFLIAVCCLAGVRAETLPSFIHPCSASDPNLNSCIEKSIAHAGPTFAQGIPALGIATLDPVQLGTVLVNNPSLKITFTETVVTGLSGFRVNSFNPALGIATLDPVQLGTVLVNNPSLKITFTETVVTGLSGFRVNSFKMHKDAGKAVFDFTANVTLKAHYDMNGQVLILPIKGNGQAKIKITNLNIVVKYDYETKDGHWVVTGYKDTYKMDRAQFKFTNLFGGNKQLADTTNRFTNENWSIIMQEIAPPAITEIIRKCIDEVKKLFAAIPATELLTA